MPDQDGRPTLREALDAERTRQDAQAAERAAADPMSIAAQQREQQLDRAAALAAANPAYAAGLSQAERRALSMHLARRQIHGGTSS